MPSFRSEAAHAQLRVVSRSCCLFTSLMAIVCAYAGGVFQDVVGTEPAEREIFGIRARRPSNPQLAITQLAKHLPNLRCTSCHHPMSMSMRGHAYGSFCAHRTHRWFFSGRCWHCGSARPVLTLDACQHLDLLARYRPAGSTISTAPLAPCSTLQTARRMQR